MKTLYSIWFLFSFSTLVSAQALVIDSTRFITGYNCCTHIEFAMPTADKGILFVGADNNNPGGIIPYFPIDTSENENALIGKIDSNHQISWIKVYGGTEDDNAFSACQTPDGGYAVLAATMSGNGDVTGYLGGGDIWLVRIDGSGNLLWEKCYGSSQSDVPMSIAATPDGGFIILGATNGSDDDVPFHYGDFFSLDWLVVKTDSAGNVQWSKDLGGTGDEGQTGSIIPASNSYYLVSGSNSTDHDCTDTAWHLGVNTGYDYYVLKLNDTGAVLWDSSYGGSGGDGAAYAMLDTRDSTIIITGSTFSNDFMVTEYQGNGDIWTVKINENGSLLWQKDLGSPNEDYGTGICISDEGYLDYGWTHNGSIGEEDLWLFELDYTGNEITNKTFGGPILTGNESSFIVPYLNGYAATGNSGATAFTEGSTYGNFDGGGAFVSYIDYWPLSVSQLSKTTSQLLVYPNPADGNVSVLIPGSETGNITIINSIGQVIYAERVNQGTNDIEINTGTWAKGLYLVQWQGEDGSMLSAKLINN